MKIEENSSRVEEHQKRIVRARRFTSRIIKAKGKQRKTSNRERIDRLVRIPPMADVLKLLFFERFAPFDAKKQTEREKEKEFCSSFFVFSLEVCSRARDTLRRFRLHQANVTRTHVAAGHQEIHEHAVIVRRIPMRTGRTLYCSTV